MLKTKIVSGNVFETIKKVVDKTVDIIKPTFGPASNKVIINKMTHKIIVDDGVQIIKDLSFEDPAENAVLDIIRETAIKTNDRVGDGTTGALIILQALLNEIAGEKFRTNNKISKREIELSLKKAAEEAKEQLLKSKTDIETEEDLKKVALVSFDNEVIAEMIAKLYYKFGKDLTITVEKSQTMETVSEESAGITIDKGYSSPYMIDNFERMETEVENPLFLILDHKLSNINEVLPIMEKIVSMNHSELVILAESIDETVLSTFILNRIKGNFKVTSVNVPSYKKDLLEDIALLTGATMFSKEKGIILPATVDEVDLTVLGKASNFICKQNESIIVKPKGDKEIIDSYINSLTKAIKNEKDENIKKDLETRLSRLTNKIAVIKAGAMTDNEQKALKYKIEDAVNSVKHAFKNGVVAGSGLALNHIETSSKILNDSLKYPHEQLFVNIGLEEPNLIEGDAINVMTNEKGNFMDVGVIDPVDAHIAAIDSAVSIATLLLLSNTIVVDYEEDISKKIENSL